MKPVANKRQPRFFSAFRNNSHADNVWFIRRAACEPGNKTMAFFDHIWQFTLIRRSATFSEKEWGAHAPSRAALGAPPKAQVVSSQ